MPRISRDIAGHTQVASLRKFPTLQEARRHFKPERNGP